MPRREAGAQLLLGLPRSYGRWLLGYGVQRGALKVGARRGDPASMLVIDPQLHQDPTPVYDQLRQGPPIHASVPMAITVAHAACDEILRSDQFGTGQGHGELPAPLRGLLGRLTDPDTLGPMDPPSMLAVDPPLHTRYRQRVARAFTPRKVGRMADRVEGVAVRLLDELSTSAAAGATFDLVDRYAALLPVAVISDLLGVPEDQRDTVLELGNLAATTLEPALSFGRYRQAERALRRMHALFAEHVQRLREHPGDDLLSHLILEETDDPLTDTELHQIGLLVLGAGFETTVNLISNAVALLDAHPDQLALLRADPGGWGNAVEEVLRFAPPVLMTVREAKQDVEVAGAALRRGTAVMTVLGGANRDPEVFTDPDTFDVTRANAGHHLSFSAGVHYCLGANLARMEAVTGLQLLYDRFPDLRVAGTPERRETRVLRGFERLPVAV
jgi:cytochrome P450